jgi:hypothetical protein
VFLRDQQNPTAPDQFLTALLDGLHGRVQLHVHPEIAREVDVLADEVGVEPLQRAVSAVQDVDLGPGVLSHCGGGQ